MMILNNKDLEDDGRVIAELGREGRHAAISGALAAWLLVGGLIAAAFAAVIFLIGQMG